MLVPNAFPSGFELTVVLKLGTVIPASVSPSSRVIGVIEGGDVPIGVVCIPALLSPDDPVHCTNSWTFCFVRPLYGELVGDYIKQ